MFILNKYLFILILIMDLSKLFQEAIDEANEALTHDKNGQYQQAIRKYLDAVEKLMQFNTINKNEILLERSENKIEEYVRGFHGA